jgi:sugar lactone lactonase YvrE
MARSAARLAFAAIIAVTVVASAAAAAAAAPVTGLTGGDKVTSFAGKAKFNLGDFSGDGGPASKAQLSQPTGVAIDAAGNVYIADTRNQRIRKVNTAGTITTIAGGDREGLPSLPGPALKAHLNHPTGVAVDAQGNVFIADSAYVYKVSPGGTLSKFAGVGGGPVPGSMNGDNGPATSAPVFPYALALDGKGNLYLTDYRRVRKINPAGIITTVAGNGERGSAGDGGQATAAQLTNPLGLAFDRSGNLLIVDQLGARVRKVNPAGIITTFAGNGARYLNDVTGRAMRVPLNNPFGVAVDRFGNVYISEDDSRIRKVDTRGMISTIVGIPRNQTSRGTGDGGPGTKATLAHPVGLVFDRKNNLYIADVAMAAIRKVWYHTAKPVPVKKPPTTKPPVSSSGTQKTVATLANRIELFLSQMASGRTKLKLALARALSCSISARTAAVQVGEVAVSRQRILSLLSKLGAPTRQAAQIKTRLQIALTHSIAADIHYRDWLARQGTRCATMTPSTPDLAAAQREDVQATAAKRRFVAAFNPLARQLHLRTWSADAI